MKYLILFGLLSSLILVSCVTRDKVAERSTNSEVEPRSGLFSGESLFQLTDSFETQFNRPFTLGMLKGKPTLVSMIFTNCEYACSRLTADMQAIGDSLAGRENEVNFLLVSFDTERDNPEQLSQFAEKMGLGQNWTLLHGSDDAVRTLSVLLDVQFERSTTGNFSHSNMISVLDKEGVIRFQKEGLNADHTKTIETLRRLVSAS